MMDYSSVGYFYNEVNFWKVKIKTDENLFFQQNCLFTTLSLCSHIEAN